MQIARLDELQTGIKVARRNINNFRYVNDTTLMGKSEEELKSLLMRVKEESEKAGLKLNIKNTNFMAAVTICSDFGDQENKVYHCFLFFPQSIYHEMMGPDAMILVY